jgi:hypothetical protein
LPVKPVEKTFAGFEFTRKRLIIKPKNSGKTFAYEESRQKTIEPGCL